MKSTSFAVVGVVVTVAVVTVVLGLHGSKIASNPKSPVSSEQRIAAKKSLLGVIHMVADKTGDEEAKAYANFAEANAVTAEPLVAGQEISARILEKASGPDRFIIMPILAEDKKVPELKVFVESHFKNATGGFGEKSNSIYFNSTSEISDAWLGILMLHELRHTVEFHTQPYDPDKETDQEYCDREKDTYEFENRLSSMYFGHEYDRYVKAQAKKMFQTLKKTGELDKNWPNQEGMKVLPPLFAGNKSQLDQDNARTQVWIDCVFHFIDAYYHTGVSEKERKKAVFLSNLYVQSGLRKSPN